MSSRWDPNTDRAAYEGALPGPDAFTLCAWVRILADVNDWRSIIRLAGAGGSPTVATLGTLSDGTTFAYISPGGTVSGSGFQLVPDRWAFLVLRSGPAPGQGDALAALDWDPLALIVNAQAVSGGSSSGMITLGGRSPSDGTESYPVDLAHVRLFSARLTTPELETERRSTEPVHASFYDGWPVLTGGDYAAINGRDLTPGATLTADASGPPLGDGVAAALALPPGTGEGGAPGDPGGDGLAAPLDLGAASSAGFKVGEGAATASALGLTASADGEKLTAGNVTAAPLNLSEPTATGERGSEGGDPTVGTPVSDVLCGAWATHADVPQEVLDSLPAEITDLMIDEALLRASEILWALSGRQWLGGGCEETAVLRSLPSPSGTGLWPYERSWGRCNCWSYGGWSLENEIPLRLYPFPGEHVTPIAVRLPRRDATVTAVTIGGTPFTEWRLTTSGWLERIDGGSWDMCDGTTEITYTFGSPPPGGGRDSAVEFGIELLKYRHKLEGCRLPKRATQITRQGVSITIDPMTFLAQGGTGLLYTDMWLRSVNPDQRPGESMVWSPDLPQTIRS